MYDIGDLDYETFAFLFLDTDSVWIIVSRNHTDEFI